VLSLAGHPRDDLASDRALIVTEMQLDGRPDSTWLFSFEAEFADVPLLPHDKTKKPTIAGMQTAIVVGPKNGDGCEIYPDEHGRVKVQLSWDRRGEFDQNSGCWARVSQAWAGTRFGAMALPRVGNEVLVAYFDGDPDMPVVVGRAFNRTRPVPYGLPEHAEKTVFKTKTSPQSDKENAFNELRFDDRKGEELIYIQAQRDYQQLVKRNDTERTGKSRASVVGGSRTSLVGKVETRLVGKKYSIQMVEKPDAPAVAIEEMDELRLLAQLEPELRPLATKLELMHEEVLATSGPASLVMSDDEIVFNAEGEFSMEADGQIVIYGGPNIKINC
jgi:type VI secretion system secreted protein VgrG